MDARNAASTNIQYKPVRYVPGRGYNIGGTGLFQGNDKLIMYANKKSAAENAKQFGWSARYIITVFTPLFRGYAIAQVSLGADTMRFLQRDGTWLDVPFVVEKMPKPTR